MLVKKPNKEQPSDIQIEYLSQVSFSNCQYKCAGDFKQPNQQYGKTFPIAFNFLQSETVSEELYLCKSSDRHKNIKFPQIFPFGWMEIDGNVQAARKINILSSFNVVCTRRIHDRDRFGIKGIYIQFSIVNTVNLSISLDS